ncbi:MAG: hypothetical protein OXF79_20915 [Chloroflexi bacterium]|nr:hypothetical protein [Chloroflexota bacterium]
MLSRTYHGAERKTKVTACLLFGIRYSAELEGRLSARFVEQAGLPANYATEVRRGMNLAQHVILREDAPDGGQTG